MTQYEHIAPQSPVEHLHLYQNTSPELVKEDDPASTVMIPLTHGGSHFIETNDNIDAATQAMKIHHTSLLLVMNDELLIGIITAQDLLGEKPITLQQKSRMQREDITVKMLMTPLNEILTLSFDDIVHARVGNVVQTLKHHHQHYALVISQQPDHQQAQLHGLFIASQISKQLHKDIQHALHQMDSVSELDKEL